MSIRILTKNNVDNTNIDGARNFNFNAGRRSGIVKGALNQGNLFSSSKNTIALDTCELRLCGHRVVIDAIEYKTLVNIPSIPIRYSLVASIVVDVNSNVSFELLLQTSSTLLTQENLDKTGFGTYQLEIGKFTQQTDGTITDIVRTADLITGGIGDLDGGAINIGNVTTNTLDAGMEAEVDVEERFEPKDKKTYTDFTFSIPKGDKGIQGEKGDQGVQGVRGEKGEKGDKGDTGATPNITATATTLPAGSSATVTKSGTAENPAFAFGIPKGDKGEKGEKGDKGESGLIYQTTGQNTDGAMSQKTTTDALNGKVPITRTVNNKALSSDITLSASDVGAITKANLLDFVYPVGSIYMSMNNTSPQTFLGGTWEQIKDCFMWATGDTTEMLVRKYIPSGAKYYFTAGSRGGEFYTSLAEQEMPSHTHAQNSHNHTQGYHMHFLLGGKSGTNAWSANVLSLKNSNNKSGCVGAVEGTEDIKAGNYYQRNNLNNYDYVQQTQASNNATTATNQNTGGDVEHNNMPPYLSCYMWKRTA